MDRFLVGGVHWPPEETSLTGLAPSSSFPVDLPRPQLDGDPEDVQSWAEACSKAGGGGLPTYSTPPFSSTDVRERENKILTRKTWDHANTDPHLIRLGKVLARSKGLKNTNNSIEDKLEKTYIKDNIQTTTYIIHRVVTPELKVAAFVQVWTNKDLPHEACPFANVVTMAKEKKTDHKTSRREEQTMPGLPNRQESSIDLVRKRRCMERKGMERRAREKRARETYIFSWTPKPTEQHPSCKVPKAAKPPKAVIDPTANHCKEQVNRVIKAVLKRSKMMSKSEKKAKTCPKIPNHPDWNRKKDIVSEKPQTRKPKTQPLGCSNIQRLRGGDEKQLHFR